MFHPCVFTKKSRAKLLNHQYSNFFSWKREEIELISTDLYSVTYTQRFNSHKQYKNNLNKDLGIGICTKPLIIFGEPHHTNNS